MALQSIIFYVFALAIVGSACIVVFSKNIMHAAFSLLFTLFGIAGIYALLMADFMAVSQIMVYVGGILVLIIFGVMLTTKATNVELKSGKIGRANYIVSGVVCSVVLAGLVWLFSTQKWISANPPEEVDTTITAIGNSLMTEYLLAFEVGAVVLLIALIGAALMARRK